MKSLVLALFLLIFTFTLPLSGFAEVGDIVAENEAGAVFEGKEGWLFYTGNDTIADYQGTDLLTQNELGKIRSQFSVVRDRLALMGKEFVIFIAPNKEQVYSRFMPDSYGELTDYTRAQQVTDYLRENGFRVVYPIDELKEAAAKYPQYDLYFKTDTHWNYLGAYVGTRALLAELGIYAPDISQIRIGHTTEISDVSAELSINLGDNYELYGYSGNPVPSIEVYPAEVVSTLNTGTDPRKVMLIGDSFTTAQIPVMGAFFDHVTRCPSKSIPALTDLIFSEEQPDVVVYETVERYVFLMETGFGLPQFSD